VTGTEALEVIEEKLISVVAEDVEMAVRLVSLRLAKEVEVDVAVLVLRMLVALASLSTGEP
jgi:hypothetical protein